MKSEDLPGVKIKNPVFSGPVVTPEIKARRLRATAAFREKLAGYEPQHAAKHLAAARRLREHADRC